jgi:hypothetical protein
MLPTKFRQAVSDKNIFLEIDLSELRIAYGGYVCYQIEPKWAIAIENLPYMLPTKFQFIWPSGFRGDDFYKSTNQKQELPVVSEEKIKM